MKTKRVGPVLPSQWVEPKRKRTKPTLTDRLVEAIDTGRGIVTLAREVQSQRDAESDLGIDARLLDALTERLAQEITARFSLLAALDTRDAWELVEQMRHYHGTGKRQ